MSGATNETTDGGSKGTKHRGARVSRASVWGWTLLSLASVAGIAGLAATLAQRTLPRLDLTAGASAGLSPRTTKALQALRGPTRIIIAGELQAADPRASRALTDVLDEMRASSPLLSVLTVDTTSDAGVDEYRAVLASLREREAGAIDRAGRLAAQAANSAAGIANELAGARGALATLAEKAKTEPAMSPVLRGIVEQGPGILSSRQQDLAALAQSIEAPLQQQIAGVNVPALEQVRAMLSAPVTATRQDAKTIIAELAKVSGDAETTSEMRLLASSLTSALTRASDQSDALLMALEQLPRLDIARVADALARGAAGIIVGLPREAAGEKDSSGLAGTSAEAQGMGLIALDIRTLLPDALMLEAAQASRTDLQRRVEDVLSTSLASLDAPSKPLLIITHADPAGAVIGSRLLEAAIERLSMRGIDALEWAAVTEAEPKAADVDPKGTRPRVYLVLAPDASAQANATGLTGSQRVQKLATVLREATRERGGLLLSLTPSILPSYGSADPLAQLAEEYGLMPLSGTPLLTDVLTPSARSVETDRLVQPVEGSQVLQSAMRGLPTYITWAIPIEAAKTVPTNAKLTALLSVPASASGPQTWAESQWQRLRAVRREDRASIPQAQLPTPDAQREKLAPPASAMLTAGFAQAQWVVGAAAELTLGAETQGKGLAQAQALSRRIIVVGSNDWAIDPVTQQGRVVDGRPVLQNPGNLELLDAGVHWLAHQDELIAQSAAATVAPMVRAMDDRSLKMVRIATIAGMPMLVLLLGVGLKVIRRS